MARDYEGSLGAISGLLGTTWGLVVPISLGRLPLGRLFIPIWVVVKMMVPFWVP